MLRDVLRDVLRMMLFVRLAGVLLILKELKPSSHPQKKIVLIIKLIPGPHYSNMQSTKGVFLSTYESDTMNFQSVEMNKGCLG